MHPDVTPPEIMMACSVHSTRTKTLLDIYFNVIIDDFKTALEVALQFFPGIKLKRENRNCASKACLLNEKTARDIRTYHCIRLVISSSSSEYWSGNRALFVEGLR